MKLVGKLKQAAQLFLGVYPPLVSPGLEPDHAVLVKIGFVDPFRYGQHDDNAAVFHRHVFGLHRKRAAHQMAGCIADELIDASHVLL